MCLRCGYDGRGVSHGVILNPEAWCPNCGCDFHRRPPRSYAEMEGLYDVPYLSVETQLVHPERASRTRRAFIQRFERCLAALFVVLVGVVVAGQLVYMGLSAIQ